MLIELNLTNWKTHENSKFSFAKGVNLLVGIMGSGKSSVTDAISYALFGTFPDLNRRKVKLTDLIMKNNSGQKTGCSVELLFSVDKDLYRVVRKINETGGTEAVLEKNKAAVQEQTTKVSEEIENVLKINYDAFSKAIYSEQNRLNYFLELVKGDRKKQIDEMLGLDQFSVAESNATSLINSIKSDITQQEKDIGQRDIAQIKESLESSKKELGKNEAEKKDFDEKIKSETQKLRGKEGEYERLKAEHERKKQLREKIIKGKAEINTLAEQISKMAIDFDENEVKKANEADKSEKKKYSNELTQERKDKDDNNRKIGEIKSMISAIEKQKNEMRDISSKLESYNENKIAEALEQSKTAIDKLKEEHARGMASIEEVQKSIKNLEGHHGKCPVCDRELEEDLRLGLIVNKKRLLKELNDTAKIADEAIAKERERMAGLEKTANEIKKIKTIKERIAEDKNINKDIEEIIRQRNALEIEIKEREDRIKRIEMLAEGTDARIRENEKKIEKAQERNDKANHIERGKINLAALEKEYAAIDIDEGKMDKLKNELGEHKIEIARFREKIDADQKYILNLRQQIAGKEKEIADFMLIQEQINAKKKMLGNLNKFKKALLEIQVQLRDRLVLSVNKLMIDIWNELYPYKNYSSIKLVPKADDYAIEINHKINDADENWIQIDSIASGGEKSMSSLALRIALSMILVPNLKMIVLDEPTHNLDANGIKSFMQALGTTLPGIIEQIFIITHDEALKQIDSANIYILERDKDNNMPTQLTSEA
ncbi:MAG: AAA family ATPase [Candidatus Marsarchaeota archaeon]|nr:AAA family ATPase [Candidatus Marsarchaeota archaeon]MCL5105830.1 AAA family ATPase [Candidatus Marsarchaeota archaeon]